MSVEDQKRLTSGTLLDHVRGNDTEAFLEELVKDEFSADWFKKDAAAERKKNKTDNRKLTEPLSSTKNIGARSILDVPKALKENKSVPAKTTSPQPQRKWTRFPTRLLTAPENKPAEKEKDSTAVETEGFAFDLDHIEDTANRLEQIDIPRDDWEDEGNAMFGIKQKKMESFLENLLHDVSKKPYENMELERIRKSSTSSQESTATSSSSNSQDQSDDMKYFSACTEEELIACKMKDVHEKFNDNICDNWVDDVELALMVMKRRSNRRDLKSDEIKDLLNNILEHK